MKSTVVFSMISDIFFPGLCGFVLAAPAQQHTRRGGWSDARQPAGGKNEPQNDPTTIKTQLHPESQYKWHKGHPKNIKFMRSRRMHD